MRHAIMPRESGGRLMLEARRVNDRLHLRVADDGPGPPDDDTLAQGNGVGLTNVRHRLAALYGDNHRFRLDRSEGSGCVVSITLPFRTHRAERASMPTPAAALSRATPAPS